MFYRWQQGSLQLFCHLQTKASRSEFAGIHGQRLKIRIQAPPVDGKANAALIEFLAAQFAVPKSRVQISSGSTNRLKTLIIVDPQQLPAGLNIQVGDSS